MLNKNIICLLLLGGSLCAQAEELPESDSLQQINEDIVYLQAQLKRAELRSELSLKESSLESIIPMDLSSIPIIAAPEFVAQDPVDGLVVISIEGYDGRMVALVSYGGPSSFQVKKGDSLSKKWKVKNIKLTSLILANGKKTKSVSLGVPVMTSNLNMMGAPNGGNTSFSPY